LTWATAASTDYLFALSGDIRIWCDATMSIGTDSVPISTGSSAKIAMPYLKRIHAYSGATLNICGSPRTAGKSVVSCLLNTDEAANSTSLGVNTDTGWLDNDRIVLASSSQTYSQAETGLLNGNASADTLTVDGFAGTGGGIANAHSGTSPTQTEVILLERNVVIYGPGTTQGYYMAFEDNSTIDIQWAYFYYLQGSGSLPCLKVEDEVTSFSCQYSSFYYARTNTLMHLAVGSTPITVDYCNFYFPNVASTGTYNLVYIEAAPGATRGDQLTFTNNIMIGGNTGKTNIGLYISLYTYLGGTISNNVTTSMSGEGTYIYAPSSTDATINTSFCDNISHANQSSGAYVWVSGLSNMFGTLDFAKIYRNKNKGLILEASSRYHQDYVVLKNISFFGNTASSNSSNIQTRTLSGASDYRSIFWIDNCTFSSDSSYTTDFGINFELDGPTRAKITNCTFLGSSGTYRGHGISDLSFSQVGTSTGFGNRWELDFYNCVFNTSGTILTNYLGTGSAFNYTNPDYYDRATFTKHNGSVGNYWSYYANGSISVDNAIYNSAAPSERLTPSNASSKLISEVKKVAIDNNTSGVISVNIRKSVAGDGTAYIGNNPTLVLRRNDAAGMTSDTILGTASAALGTFQLVSGVTPTVTDNTVVECYVDCDGTAGWINIDDWSAT
jgi:hypothetical protein